MRAMWSRGPGVSRRVNVGPGVRVWVTGAGKGLGRSVAAALARRGAEVIVSARTRQDLDDLAEAMTSAPGKVIPVPLDVTDADAVAAAVERIETDIGAVDIAVLNAGTHKPVRARDFDVADVRGLVEVNLMGVVHGLAALLPQFLARRDGRLVVVASVSGYRGLPTAAAYGATKAGLINMCEALKPEMDRNGIGLTLVNPGFVRTPLTDRNEFNMPFLMEPEDAAERLVRGIESGRFEVTFPKRLTWGLKLLRCLPYLLYFPLTRNLDRNG